MIELFHGSNLAITKIDLSKSKKGKDFGCGFYLNPNKEQAMDSIQFQIECLSADIVEMLKNTYGWDMKKSFDELYGSDTFKLICNPETGLYYEGAIYVFQYLKTELESGRVYSSENRHQTK